VEHYVGPVTLHLGTAAAFLGELDRAARDLSGAVAACERIGAAPHLVEARYELARVLIRQGRPAAARPLVRAALSAARKLGMTPFAAALSTLDVAPADPLTARERQVAVLVAKGRTNREIAAELVLSERTAQNHVQHVLTKLGFANRSQIATWVAAEMSTAGE
jgi:DNA-binding CsgD family transcriptional regulator